MSCTFESNQAVLNKVREKGFSNDKLDNPYTLQCECGSTVEMDTFETKCTNCGGIFVVTPCSQDSEANIVFVS
ncbi:hypothetical protein RZE84_07315 [Mollicutes bacterium LVI A0075]|nr:hypothetical protein RZE84_07315 [Mollicutes bacterium LVI A0075]